MNHEAGLAKLKITDPQVKKRTKKILRRLSDGHPGIHLTCEAAREMACVYLASRVEGIATDIATGVACARWGGCSEPDFMKTCTFIQSALSLKFSSAAGFNLAKLCEQYAEATSLEASAPYLQEETKVLLSLFADRRRGSSLSDTHTAAALLLVCQRDLQKHASIVNEKQLAAMASCDPRKLREVVHLLGEVVPEALPEESAEAAAAAPADAPKAAKKRKMPQAFQKKKAGDLQGPPAQTAAKRPRVANSQHSAARSVGLPSEEVEGGGGGGVRSVTGVTAERQRAERTIVYLQEVQAPKSNGKQLTLSDCFAKKGVQKQGGGGGGGGGGTSPEIIEDSD